MIKRPKVSISCTASATGTALLLSLEFWTNPLMWITPSASLLFEKTSYHLNFPIKFYYTFWIWKMVVQNNCEQFFRKNLSRQMNRKRSCKNVRLHSFAGPFYETSRLVVDFTGLFGKKFSTLCVDVHFDLFVSLFKVNFPVGDPERLIQRNLSHSSWLNFLLRGLDCLFDS